MLTSWIFCVFIWFYWLDLKIRQLGWLDFLESVGAPIFSTYLLGFLPGAEDSSHKPNTSCWFLKAVKLVFFYFLKLIHAMCELVIYMSGMHLFTMSSKMSPPGTACLELVLTGSLWRTRHFIKALATTMQSFKVPYIGNFPLSIFFSE